MRQILNEKSEGDVVIAIRRFSGLNNRIAKHSLLGRDYQIGHAYAKRLTEYSGPGGMRGALRFVWQNHLEALLREYLRGLGHAERIDETIQGLKLDFSS